jgi:predicted phage tail protein
MMRSIHLHGRLKKRFGAVHRFDVETAGEGIRALYATFPEFADELRTGHYRLTRGRLHGGMNLSLDHVNTFRLGGADLHITPAAEGSKGSGGAIKAIAGVALVGAAIFLSGGTLAAPLAARSTPLITGVPMLTWGSVALLGLGLTLAGASSMMSKAQDAKYTESTSSFTFSGPVNVNEQGVAVPLIYGQVITGSQPISSGFDIEDIGAYHGTQADFTSEQVAQMSLGGFGGAG